MSPSTMKSVTGGGAGRISLGLVLAAVMALATNQATASQSPAGCNANNLTISIGKNIDNIVSGTQVTFTITVANPKSIDGNVGCNITLGAPGLVFTCPAADGTPTGTATTLIPGGTDLPAGFGPTTFTVTCTVTVNAGVQSAAGQVSEPGALLHDNSLKDDNAEIKKTLSVNVFRPFPCVITGVTISDTSWNKFTIPSGTSPVVWVNAHIGKPSGIPLVGVTTVQFVGVTISLNGAPYALPDGVLIFDPSAGPTITTTFAGGMWQTTINPNNLSDEIFFTGAAIPVTPLIAAGAKATLSYTVQSSAPGLSFSWQWSAAVYTYWPADWNQAQIQPYHSNYHAGTPLNTTIQKSLIQGPRGGGGSNFTGSWSATGTAACP